MNTVKIKRESLKHNFLKRIIARLDFNGVLDGEIEGIIAEEKEYLKTEGFSRYQEKKTRELGFDIDIDVEPEGHSIKNAESRELESYKIYSFMDENRGIKLDISKKNICVNISSSQYMSFDDYIKYIIQIGKKFQEQIDFLQFTRFGIRKINQCGIKDINKVHDFFNIKHFNIDSRLEGEEPIKSTEKKYIKFKKYNLIETYDLQQGKIEDEYVYRIALDLDIFVDEEKRIEQLINDKISLSDMNNALFEIYLSALKDEFIQQLQSDEEFCDEILIGVMDNE